ncbi:MAG: hypothetical protein WDN48_03835 [Pseudolabrys sp.]
MADDVEQALEVARDSSIGARSKRTSLIPAANVEVLRSKLPGERNLMRNIAYRHATPGQIGC